MKTFTLKSELKSYLNGIRKDKIVSFIPTMGSLHEGHFSLLQKAKESSDIVICSIFVNPTQFNNSSDLEKYPRTTEIDITRLTEKKCTILYLPEASDLYQENEQAKQFYFDGLDNFMEGERREGHFNGVATIVEKLFNIINPEKAFFGEKDLQQLQIIKYITQKLQFPIEIIGVATKREESGLAMSSRNKLLSEKNLQKATLIYQTLQFIEENSRNFTLLELKKFAIERFNNQIDLNLEYLEIVSLDKLQPISEFRNKNENAACIAASISSVRLIDNIIF
ncbi:MAG: pantoate--beta-alanine ligase [Flavobacteriales bacterium]|nr:pantoate--beta-alanine ligase [Flavobacteriales bacterium]MDG1718877.1 pantoate--beta-alanine ligase [Flavobacteriales bacterium]|tara:strand:+ start:942 stop:1781 length:840 start_codon:yes stop_codon:yes gene_type:complete